MRVFSIVFSLVIQGFARVRARFRAALPIRGPLEEEQKQSRELVAAALTLWHQAAEAFLMRRRKCANLNANST